jgi:peptide/nickel transport system substrate-binding protein
MGGFDESPAGPKAGGGELRLSRRDAIAGAAAGVGVAMAGAGSAAAAAQAQLTYAVHISLAPTWFDPAETSGLVTPYMLLYAMHDAVAKPMPDSHLAPALAESWSVSPDGHVYEFTLREGAKFHNGELVTADDVKFSFERYRGSSAAVFKSRVASIEALDPRHARFTLKQPWPDFMMFYASTTGAGWIVPRKYAEKVGDDGFKKAPVGAGPYKFVSFNPGVELVLEAFDQYWRKPPPIKRLVLRVIPDESTRLAALKRGEVDIAYSLRGELAEEVVRTQGLTLKPVVIDSPFWLYFPDQWNAKSPWHDVRVRQAAALALDMKAINDALTLGHSRLTNSMFPDSFDFYRQPPPMVYDPEKAKKLLAEAGHPNGFDAGEYFCDISYANLGEAVVDNLQAVGVRARLRPSERAAFIQGISDKIYKNIVQIGSGAFGNVATRLESWIVKGGPYVYGSYPQIDELFAAQAAELDRGRRTEILHKMQMLVHELAVVVPLWQLAFINGQGARVGESSFGKIAGFPYTAPYEDQTLKRM